MAEATRASVSTWLRQSRNWRIVSARSMFSRFFSRLTMDYGSIYIRQLGADPFQLGIVNGVSNVTGAFASTIVGWLNDRYSLRKMFLVGVGLNIIVTAIYALATDWTMTIYAMLLSTLAVRMGSCLTICDVSLKNEDRSTCKGICDGFFAIPSVVAPISAALVIAHFGGISVEGIKPLYWIQTVAETVLLLFLVTQMTEIVRPKASAKFGFIGDHREVFAGGTALKRYLIFSVVSTFSINMSAPFMQPFAYEIKGADQYVLGAMTTASLLVQILFSPLLGSMADRTGRKRIVYIAEPFYWASVLLLVFAPSPEYLTITSILGAFRLIANYVSLTPLMVELVPIDRVGRWRGIVGLFNGLVAIPAPIIGGLIWEWLGPAHLIIIPVLIDIFAAIPLLTTIPELRRNRNSEITG